MHNLDHDLDLVAAYAEGSASRADAALVDEWISTCAECAQEFESQQFAIDSLRLVEPAVLSDIERARLHRGVREAIAEVQLEDSPRARPAPATGRWLKLLTGAAAAVLVLVVTFGVVLPRGGDTTSDDLAFKTTQTSVAAATAAPSATLATNDDTMMAESAADAAGAYSMSAVPPVVQLGELTHEDLATLSAPIENFNAANATPLDQDDRTREAPLPADREAYRQAVEQPLTCTEEGLSLIDGEPIWFGIATIDGQLIELFRSETGLIALEASTCVLVFPTD